MQFTDDETASPEAFCAALKTARERKGVSLEAIADATKIGIGHLTALERGDLRHWPKGIFRRSFFGHYAKAIDIPADTSLAAFKRLFPDGTEPPDTTPPSPEPAVRADGTSLPLVTAGGEDADEDGDQLRITLALPPALGGGGWRAVLIALADSVIAWATGLKTRLGATGPAHQPLSLGPDPLSVSTDEHLARGLDIRRAQENAPTVRVRIHLPRSIRTRERRSRVSGASPARPRY